MKKLCLLALLLLVLTSCGSSRKTAGRVVTGTATSVANKKVRQIITHAKTFEGTRYRFGGTTKSGMDCSGLVYVSFKKEGIALPRVSRDMATRGKHIPIKAVRAGDLVFFQTDKNRKVINHVGLVIAHDRNGIAFIHATSSRGVIISLLSERYWNDAFIQARRVI